MNSGEQGTVVFKLDLGRHTGWGHLARCAALAAELGTRGWYCVLWTDGDLAEAPPDLRLVFRDTVPAGDSWADQPPERVVSAAWVVVDELGVDDATLRRFVKALGRLRADGDVRVLAIDDEAKRRLDAATLILNTRLGLENSSYADGVRALLGERYALLRPGLARPEPIVAPFPADAEGVLVMLGGTDPRGLTPVVLDALADIDPVRFCPVVVRTQSTPDSEEIGRALDRFSASAWVESLGASALAGWAGCCRYAISASGGSLYELAAFRLPFVAIVVSENQRPFASAVGNAWQIPVVDVDTGARVAVAAAFRALLAAHGVARDYRKLPARIDGRGAARVADAMMRV